jgi:hypothetical protein
VDEGAPAAPPKKRKQHTNGEEVRALNILVQSAVAYEFYFLRSNRLRSLRKLGSTLPFT